ncbi:carboxylesterase 5A-like [Neodiprion virginianus]|uniref:carboxylesterase 5A-like n=1 Tax=Neodiprion virginianus TaxID=2961670 RepID=UPI001EE6FEB8|nr:carboxylesterase 5A-like [Neodiprion virginianus]
MKNSTRFAFTLSLLALFCNGIPNVDSQRTHARQGVGREPPTIKIPLQGSLIGKEMTWMRTQKVFAYLGIPYAKPPIRQLRFAAPDTNPLPSWSGIKEATTYAPSCQQVEGGQKLHERTYLRLLAINDADDPGVSEDCLYLNVFVPDGNPPGEGWPVMVWFHGGDFNTGTPAIWDATVFSIKQKMLIVTVAYRLNILGFFTSTDAEAPGNYGMLDQIAALDWVQKNIQYFSGQPDNVAIYGHSSGAISVGLHILSPLSRGKFSKAIAMSGDAIGSVGSPKTETSVVDQIAEKFGCNRHPTTDLIKCLRNVRAEILVQESSHIETWGPIVDYETNNTTEPFLPEDPLVTLEMGNFNAVPLLVGYSNNEQALAYIESIGNGRDENADGALSSDKFEALIDSEITAAAKKFEDNTTCEVDSDMLVKSVLFYYKPYPPTKDEMVLRDRYLDLQTEKNYAAGLTLLAGKVSRQKSAFVYRFDYRPRTAMSTEGVPDWAGVPHMFELQFVWGLPHAASSVQWNPADKKMADVMMTLFSNFVKTANPSQASMGVKWEPYTEENPGILLIDRTINMSDHNAVDYKALAFWNEYYPIVLEEARSCDCNNTSAAQSLTSASSNFHIVFFTAVLQSIVAEPVFVRRFGLF